MKLAGTQIETFLAKPGVGVYAVLLYGPDQGRAEVRRAVLCKTYAGQDKPDVLDFNSADVVRAPGPLLEELFALSFFGGARILHVRQATDGLTEVLKDAFVEGRMPEAKLIVSAGELAPKSSLRKWFEAEKFLAALPCYRDDERGVATLLREAFHSAGVRAAPEALDYLKSHLGNDYAVSRKELEKILLYLGDAKTLSLEDAAACVGENADLTLDKLALAILAGKADAADRIAQQLRQSGTAAYAALYTLSQWFERVALASAAQDKGASQEEAITCAGFYAMQKMQVAPLLGKWNAEKALRAVSLLGTLEHRQRQGLTDEWLLLEQAIFALARMPLRAMQAA